MKPTSNKILIEADKPKTKTDGGLYIPEQDWKTLPPTGTVMAIGPDVTTVKVGDRVLFERYGAITVKDESKLCLEQHIMAILDEPSK